MTPMSPLPPQAAEWRPDAVLRALLLWTSVLTITVWVPLVRASIEGHAYQWSFASGIGSQCVGGSYWVLLLSAVFVITLFYFGWRGARQPFPGLLIMLHGFLASIGVYAGCRGP